MSASLVEDIAAPSELVQFLKRPLAPVVVGPAAPEPLDVEPSSYTPLHVGKGHKRNLSSINRLQSLDSKIEDYFTTFPNSERLVSSLQSLTLPLAAPITLHHPGSDILYTDFNPFIINSPNDLITLLHRFLLRSICQILRVLYSLGDTAGQDWTFTTIPFTPSDGRVEEMASNPDPIVLHPCGSASTTKPDNVRLVILPFTPWEFTRQDFLNLTFLPIRRFDNDNPKRTKYDQVWAYLYDICFDLNCPYFVITSYQQWCFGCFSPDYSTIIFALPVPFDECRESPSVMQMLIYWILNQTIESKYKKRLREEDSPPMVKRQRVHRILEAGTTEAWRRMQCCINFKSRYSPEMAGQRKDFDRQHIKDQRNFHEKSKDQARAIALAKRAKKAKKARKIRMAQAERAEKVDEAIPRIGIVEMPSGTGKTEEDEEALNVDEMEGEPSVERNNPVEGASKVEEVEAVDEAPGIEEVKGEVTEKTDMISRPEGVKETTVEEARDDGMQICEEAEDSTQTSGQLKADKDMGVEEANMTNQIEGPGGVMTVEVVDATERVKEPERCNEPEEKPESWEESDSDDSALGIGEIHRQKLKTACDSWQAKVNKFNNTKNEYIYFEQPDSRLVMFGDKEAYLATLRSNYVKKLEPTLGGALDDFSKDDMYRKMEKISRILYLEKRTCHSLRSIIERYGWNIFFRKKDYYFPSLTPSVDTKCWSSSHLAHHLFLAEQAWRKRRFAPRQLGPDWNTNFHPALALHNHRLIVGAGNSLICYNFKPSPSISETTRVSFDQVVAFPKDARKDIVGIEFHNSGNDLILAFVHGGLGRVKLRESTAKRTCANLPSMALIKSSTNAPRIKDLSICGDTALTVDSSGTLSLFSLKHPRPEVISATNPFSSDKDKSVVTWSNYLSLTSSAGYAAVGISSSSSSVPLSIYPILESTISNQASAHLSPLTSSEDKSVFSTAVYAITGGNSSTLGNRQFYSDQIVISGWFHGSISIHDLRCPSRNDKILPPVLLLRDPLALSAIYSLSIADHRVAAGSAQHGLLQLYDVRAPRSGFSIYLPTARGASSPVYSTIMESTRVWAATASCAHAIDFGRVSHNTFPTIPSRRGQVQVPRVKAPMYEHSDHHLSPM